MLLGTVVVVRMDPDDALGDAIMRTMTSQFFPSAALLLAGIACLSCGSGSSYPANVYITSTLGLDTSAGATNMCNISVPNDPFVTIGSPNTPAPTGGTYNGEAVNVTCVVDQSGTNMYTVNISVSDGQIGGITIGGVLNSTPGAMQGNVTASFNKLNTVNYTEDDCTLTLSTAAEFSPPIAGGRIAGSIVCPAIADDQTNNTCYATATFFLDNCD